MVDFLSSVEREFLAIHTLEGCLAGQHAHQWRVRVTVSGMFDPTSGLSSKLDALDAALGLVVAEVEGRDLNAMVPQSKPTAEGIGMWFLDRLLPTDKKIVEVEVEWLDQRRRFSIRRQPR